MQILQVSAENYFYPNEHPVAEPGCMWLKQSKHKWRLFFDNILFFWPPRGVLAWVWQPSVPPIYLVFSRPCHAWEPQCQFLNFTAWSVSAHFMLFLSKNDGMWFVSPPGAWYSLRSMVQKLKGVIKFWRLSISYWESEKGKDEDAVFLV